MFDVIVVGAGCAGLTFSKFVAEKGFRVLVLEKEKSLCVKPCGEYVTNYDFGGVRFDEIYGSRKGLNKRYNHFFLDYYGEKVEINTKLIDIDKKIVYKELARQAVKNGAEIRMGEKVKQIKRCNGFIEVNGKKAKLVVGADGYSSTVRRFVGGKKPMYFTGIRAFAKKSLDAPAFFVKDDYTINGYAWAFPKKGGLVNLGVGEFFINDNLKKGFEKFCEDFGVKPFSVEGGIGPCSLPIKSYHDNVLLVGDSCSQISALSGGGISIAMFCALKAAETANKFLKKGVLNSKRLKEYEVSWRKVLMSPLRESFFLASVYNSPLRKLLPKKFVTNLLKWRVSSKSLL